MARRDFRQLGLADSIVRRRGKKSEWLDRLDAALDWPALEMIVEGIYQPVDKVVGAQAEHYIL